MNSHFNEEFINKTDHSQRAVMPEEGPNAGPCPTPAVVLAAAVREDLNPTRGVAGESALQYKSP